MNLLPENIDGILTVVYCFLIGIIVAFVISLFTKSVYGKLVDALVKYDADSIDSAKTLKEIKIKRNLMISHALSRRTTLSSVISCANSDADESERRYYILPEHKIKAQTIYGRESISPISIIVAVVIFAVILILLEKVIPKFIS